MTAEDCSNQQNVLNSHNEDNDVHQAELNQETADDGDQLLTLEDEDQESDHGTLVSVHRSTEDPYRVS